MKGIMVEVIMDKAVTGVTRVETGTRVVAILTKVAAALDKEVATGVTRVTETMDKAANSTVEAREDPGMTATWVVVETGVTKAIMEE
jgi:hypothetical protein